MIIIHKEKSVFAWRLATRSILGIRYRGHSWITLWNGVHWIWNRPGIFFFSLSMHYWRDQTAGHQLATGVCIWSGSKRGIAPQLARLFPEAERYFEPFAGGGAMLPFRTSWVALAGDIIVELIDLSYGKPSVIRLKWSLVSMRYAGIVYRPKGISLTMPFVIHSTSRAISMTFYSWVEPVLMVSFALTAMGISINSLHHTRPGIAPVRLREVIYQWSYAIQGREQLNCEQQLTALPDIVLW